MNRDAFDPLDEAFATRFGEPPHAAVRVPARVDLMGSHTDYNLGKVMTMAIDRELHLAGRRNDLGRVRACSMNLEAAGELDLASLETPPEADWLRYVAGVIMGLKKRGHEVGGFDCVLRSAIPMASGLSSSAALEVGIATLIEVLFGITTISKLEKARLCQAAEVDYVGVNCGILDQYSVVMGEAGRTVVLDCLTQTHDYARFPEELLVVICNTRAPRQLMTSAYGERRAHCQAAFEALAPAHPGARGLCDIPMESFLAHAATLPPEVERRARFILEEHKRVDALQAAFEAADETAIGQLFRQSFEGARGLFEIVNEPMAQMHEAMLDGPGVVGARQAGAGFGGCLVAVVRRAEADAFMQAVGSRYASLSGITPELYPVRPAQGASVR